MTPASDRAEFRAQLAALDLSKRPVEFPFRQRMLNLIDSTPDCFERSSSPAHFTGIFRGVTPEGL